MAEREMGVAMLGAGFMGKAHSNAWARVYFSFLELKAKPVMKVLCGTPEEPLQELAEHWGWQETSTDWRAAIARDDIQIVDIGTPNYLHRDMAVEAARQGKHIFLEKPMAMNLDEAKEMLQAVREAGVKAVVNFNYRRVPAVQLAKGLIEGGKLGQIYHFRATYLQDWIVDPNFPLVWRLQKKVTGTGVHGDLNAHIIDLARFLVGEIKEVVGGRETFIKERPLPKEAVGLAGEAAAERGQVDVDDATAFLARMEEGAIGVFESTRFATGRKNQNRFEINGSKGSLCFNLERLNELEFYSREEPEAEQGWKVILVTEKAHPYIEAWWPPGHIIGWEHTFVHQVYEFLKAIEEDREPSPSFLEGARCQAVLDAVVESIERREWVEVPKVE